LVWFRLPTRRERDAAPIMRVIVNDQPTELPAASTVADLLATLALPGTRVAVEVNRQLVRRLQHGETRQQDGDTVEVVTLVGGG
jgi:thiamine biosynthesis protein ThiS